MERLSFELIEAAKTHRSIDAVSLTPAWRPAGNLKLQRALSMLFVLLVIPQALIQARRFDVIHIGDPVLSLVGWLIKKIHRKPVIVTVHGLDITYASGIYRWYLARFFRNFDMYLPISSHVASLLQRHHVQGKVEVLNPGVHDRYYNSGVTRSDLVNYLQPFLQTPLPDTARILFTAGRLVKRKGHEWFIRKVMPQLPSHVIYVISGNGPELSAIKKAITDNGFKERVVLLGRVSSESLQMLYNTIDVFVQPNISISGDMEGFGLVLVEAALCDRVVVASNIEGIKDAIHDGKNGYLVEPENTEAWRQAIEHGLLVENNVGIQPRAYSLGQFSWAQTSQRLHELLSSLSPRD